MQTLQQHILRPRLRQVHLVRLHLHRLRLPLFAYPKARAVGASTHSLSTTNQPSAAKERGGKQQGDRTMPKGKVLNPQEQLQIWNDFLSRWPVEKIRNLTLEQYTSIGDKDTFCWWLEHGTNDLGGIKGGEAAKFGIYHRGPGKPCPDKRAGDETYSWQEKYGQSCNEVFGKVKKSILQIIEYVQRGREEIDEIDALDIPLYPIVKWKIAFLYQPKSSPTLLPIYTQEKLSKLASMPTSTPVSQLQKTLMSKKPANMDLLEYYDYLLQTRTDVFETAAAINSENGAKAKNYWWLNCNKKERKFSFADLSLGRQENWNGKGTKKSKVKENDLVLGYAVESREIVCICSVTRKDKDGVWMKKILDLETPVTKEDWEKEQLHSKNQRGTLFKLSDKDWNDFMNLIEVKNPGVRKKLDDSLKDVERSDSQAQVSEPKDKNGKPLSRNCIYFGAPGTGKSFTVDKTVANDDTAIRTTFHPDSDYASFVGSYKPTMEVTGKARRIVYSFVPQAFTKAYVQAWEKMAKNPQSPERQYLVIEEINRGNCAQIFGDLFQLLDRDDNGYSNYPIDPDADLADYLCNWFKGNGEYVDKDGNKRKSENGVKLANDKEPLVTSADAKKSETTWADIRSGRKLVLPPNLYIWATMNTSDQSLFPMDSAFKRRWEWKYSKISEPEKDENGNSWPKWEIQVGSGYGWWDFLKKINVVIRDVTQSADKQLGYFFVKLPKGQRIIDAETFVNKVIFYLWNDVFKDCELNDDAFMVDNEDEKDSGNNTNSKRQLSFDDFFYDNGEVNEEVVKVFLDKLLPKKPENNGSGEASSNPGGES